MASVTFDSKTSVFSTSRSKSSLFSTFMVNVTDPVDSWVIFDSVMVDIDHDAFIIFVGSVLSNPIGVEKS